MISTVEDSDDAEITTAFLYDNNGNQTSKQISTITNSGGSGTGDEITYETDGYDTFGRLISIQNDFYTAVYT